MTVAVTLLAYAALLGLYGPRALGRSHWMQRAPRLGIVAWQAACFSFVAAVVLGGLALSIPTVRVSTNLAAVLQACVVMLQAQYTTPGGAAVGIIGATIAVGVLARCVYCVADTMASAAARRRRHRCTLRLVGRPGPARGVFIVDHGAPAAYCLPGLRRHVVLTSAAVDTLDERQLRAVLAHERAHLRARHDLVVAAAIGMAVAFSRLRLFQAARTHILELVELAADDAAARSEHRLTVAEALLAVASGERPAGALAASDLGSADRVRRLIARPRPLGRSRAALSGLAVSVLLVGPALLLAAPAAATAGSACCVTDPSARPTCHSSSGSGDCLPH